MYTSLASSQMKPSSTAIVATAVILGFTHPALGSIMYWADQNDGAVLRANLDGTGQQVLINVGSPTTTGIALDLVSDQMFFTNQGSSGNIERANLDGTDVTPVVTGGVSPFGIALDITGNEMYWTV